MSEPFRDRFAALDIKLPLRLSPDTGVILDDDGKDILTVDSSGVRADAAVERITELLVVAINMCGESKADLAPSSATPSSDPSGHLLPAGEKRERAAAADTSSPQRGEGGANAPSEGADLGGEQAAEDIPVDRSARQLSGGGPVTEDHRDIRPESGQQKGYVVLTPAERAKGFVRPYRDAYRHMKCGKVTTMSRDIAETYARDPQFYSGTFCTTCRGHFPVGESGQFTWYEMDGHEGPKVGT